MAISRLERAVLREVWAHEALDFTTWLEANVDLINEVIPLDLQPDSVRRESAAGAFRVDLVAEDANGDIVVIENQLEKSDHYHLGKVLVYLSELKAKNAVWIVAEARSEHISAVEWLNSSGLAKFWLLTIDAVRIGSSPYAPVLTLVTGPREVQGDITQVRIEKSDRDSARQRFFSKLLPVTEESTNLFAGLTPSSGPYQSARSGFPGINYVLSVRKDATAVMLWIERGVEWADWNNAVFESLQARKSEIEQVIGQVVEWDAKEGNRSRKLIVRLEIGGWQDESTWDEICTGTSAALLKLQKGVAGLLKAAVTDGDRVIAELIKEDE